MKLLKLQKTLQRRFKLDTDNNFGLSVINGESIPLEGVKVKAHIDGRGSKVKITQSFKNMYKNAIEAVYKFPLPADSAVCGFRAVFKGTSWG